MKQEQMSRCFTATTSKLTIMKIIEQIFQLNYTILIDSSAGLEATVFIKL